MTCTLTDGARKFRRWRYRPTRPHLEGPSRLKSTYSIRLAGLPTRTRAYHWPASSLRYVLRVCDRPVRYILSGAHHHRDVTWSKLYVTSQIKAKLRRKNRLMRAGQVEEAAALARQIGRDITRCSRRQLKSNATELWLW